MGPRVFYVGTENEVAHHAQPLTSHFDVEIVEPEKISQVATADDLAIFFTEHFERFRIAIHQLRESGCRTLYAIDGILEWRNAFENRPDEPAVPWTMRPVLSHKVAAIGRSQARLLSFWGNQQKVELVGLPRLDSLQQDSESRAGDQSIKTQSKPAQNGDRPLKIMVMTAKWPAFTPEQQACVEQSLMDLKRWTDQDTNSGLEIIWRLTGGLEEKVGVSNSLTSTNRNELIEQLSECDALITTPSTAMLEGMLLGKPTAVLEYNPCPQLTQSVWQIRHETHIEPVMRELLNPTLAKLAQQEFCLHDSLECRSPATARFCQLVETMLNSSPGELPAHIVPIDDTVTKSSLGFEFLFNNHQLVESNDLLELKAHIASLQRETERLTERNKLVESEFDRAKSTIDHVFSNPLVSPFIKAGEFAGRLLGKNAKS